MGIVRQDLQTMLQAVVEGRMTFDDYVDGLGESPPPSQLQLKAALEQRRLGKWSQEEYARIRDEIRAEFDLRFRQQSPVAPPPRIFNPLAEPAARIPEGLQVTVLPSAMGSRRKGSAPNPKNPTRTRSGRFRSGVAEVCSSLGAASSGACSPRARTRLLMHSRSRRRSGSPS